MHHPDKLRPGPVALGLVLLVAGGTVAGLDLQRQWGLVVLDIGVVVTVVGFLVAALSIWRAV